MKIQSPITVEFRSPVILTAEEHAQYVKPVEEAFDSAVESVRSTAEEAYSWATSLFNNGAAPPAIIYLPHER